MGHELFITLLGDIKSAKANSTNKFASGSKGIYTAFMRELEKRLMPTPAL